MFIAKRDFAAFVNIETVIPEKDFDQNVSKLTNEDDVLVQVNRDEMLARSFSYNPGCRTSGKISNNCSLDRIEHHPRIIIIVGQG